MHSRVCFFRSAVELRMNDHTTITSDHVLDSSQEACSGYIFLKIDMRPRGLLERILGVQASAASDLEKKFSSTQTSIRSQVHGIKERTLVDPGSSSLDSKLLQLEVTRQLLSRCRNFEGMLAVSLQQFQQNGCWFLVPSCGDFLTTLWKNALEI